jgi:hypothetical protein
MTNAHSPSLEDVLDAFAAEPDPTLALPRYLSAYMEHALDLVDLARELRHVDVEDDGPLTAADEAIIRASWRKHQEASPHDPFPSLSPGRMRELAVSLDVPRQVLTSFRERRVIVESVPRTFLQQLASALGRSVEALLLVLQQPPERLARSYKSDSKPSEEAPVTFERLLLDAGVSEARRSALLSGDVGHDRG